MTLLGRTRTAVSIARSAADAIRRADTPRLPRLKRNVADLQTATDRAVEELIRRQLSTAFPGEAIIGEETVGPSEHDWTTPAWLVDPIDGTTNYFRGLPAYAVNLAFWDGTRVALGVIADVPRRRIYAAERGRGAWRGRRRLRVASTSSLERACLSTGFPPDMSDPERNNLEPFVRVVPLVRSMRRLGCAGLDMAAVATGTTDGYWELSAGPWDWAAGAVLVEEAGGRVTARDGTPWHPADGEAVATNARIHEELLTCLRARATAG
ncbi:inositol monophosphatase [Egibacter rhizosphaerae]|uniref:Inositol-1-monophosphatase n=1 Tax=Egibacter rhizosphaerae TaxID=1670831 RepID=A0A411YIB0_9ACTN|nr:inositol monophosphatase family protein [Egibacter rhizosphaerae]QBI20881.1 inositol monophosphatase [Egibacter rhizosphaerae]